MKDFCKLLCNCLRKRGREGKGEREEEGKGGGRERGREEGEEEGREGGGGRVVTHVHAGRHKYACTVAVSMGA